MKVSFEYTKEQYKKYLLRSRFVNNIILFIIGIIIYLFITLNKVSLIYLPIFILAILIFLFLMNKLYVFAYLKVNDMLNYNTYGKYIIELTPNKFSVTVNNSKIDYKYNKISKVVEGKDYFKIKFKKSRDYLMFEKKMFNELDYNNMISIFKEKSKN